MIKPNFLIVGVARCGTTSLFKYLSQHPEIDFGTLKEPKYFSSIDITFPQKGPGDATIDEEIIKDRKTYFKLYDSLNAVKCIGDASSDYFYFAEKTIPHIKNELGDPKIIICLRNPVERTISAYNTCLRDSRERYSFNEALKLEKQRIKKGYDWMWHYTQGSMYSKNLKLFLDNFTNVKVIIFEEFIQNPSSTIKDIFKFLGVNSNRNIDVTNTYSSSSGKPINFFTKFLASRTGVFVQIRKIIKQLIPREILEQIGKKLFKKVTISDTDRHVLKLYFREDVKNVQNYLKRTTLPWE